MVTHNNITGDKIQSKANSKKFRDNFEKIFGAKNKKEGACGSCASCKCKKNN